MFNSLLHCTDTSEEEVECQLVPPHISLHFAAAGWEWRLRSSFGLCDSWGWKTGCELALPHSVSFCLFAAEWELKLHSLLASAGTSEGWSGVLISTALLCLIVALWVWRSLSCLSPLTPIGGPGYQLAPSSTLSFYLVAARWVQKFNTSLCHSSNLQVPSQFTFLFSPFRIFLYLFDMLCPGVFLC